MTLPLICDIVKKSGSWYSYNEERLGQGRETVKSILKDHPELADEIENKIIAQLKSDGEAEKEPEVSEEEFSEIMDMIIDEDGVVIE